MMFARLFGKRKKPKKNKSTRTGFVLRQAQPQASPSPQVYGGGGPTTTTTSYAMPAAAVPTAPVTQMSRSLPQAYGTYPMPAAKCQYDYDASDASELSFKEGQTVILLKESADGWNEGFVYENPGAGKGLFPMNYANKLPQTIPIQGALLQQFGFSVPPGMQMMPAQHQPQQSYPSPVSAPYQQAGGGPNKAPSAPNFAQAPAPVPVMAVPHQPPPMMAMAGMGTTTKPYLKALYDFEASDEDELRLKEGDKFILLKDHGEWKEGFVLGHPKRGKGMVPSSYVEGGPDRTVTVPLALLQRFGAAPAGYQVTQGSATTTKSPSAPGLPPGGGAVASAASASASASAAGADPQLVSLLSSLNMSHYLPNFVTGEVMYGDLPMLLEDDQLAAECVPKRSPRLRLLKAIRESILGGRVGGPPTAPEYY